MPRQAFSFEDLTRECIVQPGYHQLDSRPIGARIEVPSELWDRYPYNASAYAFLQELRSAIYEYGLIEFPGLPLNRTNHTLAQRAPREHTYSPNPYLTDICQTPHQDTPPLPTAFWLGERRRFYATWVVSHQGLDLFAQLRRTEPGLDIETVHRRLVPRSLVDGTGLLVNREPGLVLLDNSDAQSLYHARTCQFEAVAAEPGYETDSPSYAYNEVGLLNYLDSLDIRRGTADLDATDRAEVEAFLARERQPATG